MGLPLCHHNNSDMLNEGLVFGAAIQSGLVRGANTSVIPGWQAECSKSHNQDLLVSIEVAVIVIRTLISYRLDFVCAPSSPITFYHPTNEM